MGGGVEAVGVDETDGVACFSLVAIVSSLHSAINCSAINR